ADPARYERVQSGPGKLTMCEAAMQCRVSETRVVGLRPSSPRLIRCRLRRQRRGATLILVLCAALIVSVIGLSGLTVARLNVRRGSQGNDWTEAGVLAMAGVENALAAIDNNYFWWRWTYANDAESTPRTLGHGTVSWKLVDDSLEGTDGSLADDFTDPV